MENAFANSAVTGLSNGEIVDCEIVCGVCVCVCVCVCVHMITPKLIVNQLETYISALAPVRKL